MMRWNKLLLVVLVWFACGCRADTFVNKKTGEKFEGYATKVVRGTKVTVRNAANEEIRYIEPSDYDVNYSPAGRKQQVFVIELNEPLLLECETEAFEKTIKTAENQGPLAVVIKLDTPGGRVDLMKRYCSAIASVDIMPMIGIVCSGKNGGAYSAGAVIAMGCDKLYMEENSAIGAATLVVADVNDGLKSATDKFGQDIGEKFDSAHRAYCVSVAEQGGRSGLVAQAMVDRQTEVIAVKTEEGKYEIRDGRELREIQKAGKEFIVVNPKGSLLTLSAQKAAEIGFADGRIDNFSSWKRQGAFAGYKFVPRKEVQAAHRQYELYDRQCQAALRTILQLDGKIAIAVSKDTHSRYTMRTEALNEQIRVEVRQALGSMIYQYKQIIALKKKCPDLPFDLDEAVFALDQLQVLHSALSKK